MLAHTEKRLTARITDPAQDKLQAAPAKVGKSVDGEAVMVLTRSESLRLLELTENPPPRNATFLQAQARYQRLKKEAQVI